jgi:hypothetical protein
MSLWAEFLTHDERIVRKWTHYFPAYERHFGRFVNQSITMLEIGCGLGGSLQMWKRYFGPAAQIVGVDIRKAATDYAEHQIEIRIGDQGDPEFLGALVDELGPFDVILDDGSHQMAHMSASFLALYPTMPRNGVYAVEDLHTCYQDRYGGGYRREGTFIEVCKGLVDELNADLSRKAVGVTQFSRTTTSMHFYPSIVFFERGQFLPRLAPRIGNAADDSAAARDESGP